MLTRINEFPGLFPLRVMLAVETNDSFLGVSILRVGVEVRLAVEEIGVGIEVGEETETGDFF